jgi:N-acetylmuramoyl-L-alanine amidase
MVQGLPWPCCRGILVAFTLLAVSPAPAPAETLAAAEPAHDGIAALLESNGASGVQRKSASPVTVAAPAKGTSKDNGLEGDKRRTRFLVGLPRKTKFEVFSLSSPNRVIIDVAEQKLSLPEQPKDKPMGLVKSFRAGQASSESSRIILSVTEPVIVASAKIEKAPNGPGQRLVVEIEPFGPVTGSIEPDAVATQVAATPDAAEDAAKSILPPPFSLGASGLQPPLPRPAVSPEVLAERAFKPVIVIDPGHGGHDSGAMKNGAVEKDIVLAFGKTLAEKLRATGRFKVLLTRDEDVFVPLGDRVSFAEKHKANLFIAVHCDYADTGGKANGATIYSLRDSVANSLRRSAKGSLEVLSKDEAETVKKASGDVDAVRDILADLAGREVDATRDRTSAFARTVIEMMGATTNMRDDPDKQASFRVLKTAQFPSVLIELAYVTNKQDAANLKSDTWRDKVTDSILTAVDNYFRNQLAQLPM